MDLTDTALVLAAHGDRGSAERNAILRRHTAILRDRAFLKEVNCGVLNGEPPVSKVLEEAAAKGVSQILVYPFFMSAGYFVKKVLAGRISQAGLAIPVMTMAPLGLDPGLPGLMLRRSLNTAESAGFDPKASRLLIVGHGSKFGRASANATKALANTIRARNAFAKVAVAFLEETPFLRDELRAEPTPTVVAGFFSGEGMHGHDDVPAAMDEAGIRSAYTRPIGSDEAIPGLIETAVKQFHSSGSSAYQI
jgi:sirohydrochlorin cobaltochelatase